LASGIKTNSGTIGMDTERRYPLKSITETAKERGMKVGIITNVDITHATPAAFYAHQPSRNNYYEIGRQMAYSNFDFFGGGDIRQKTDPKGIEKDNILDLAKQNGFLYINNVTAFRYLEPGAGRVLFVHPDVKTDFAMPYRIDMDPGSITLADIVEKAINMLNGPEGFFIMIEGGKIDWACHFNDAGSAIQEVLDLDDAVKTALDFYSRNKKNTLIVITADHETGGMSMGTTYGDGNVNLSKLRWQTASFTQLTREYGEIRTTLIERHGVDAVKADPAWAMDFVREQTGLGDESKGLGLRDFEQEDLLLAYERSFLPRNERISRDHFSYTAYEPFMVTASRILSRKAGIGWTTFNHTGTPVPVRAFGVGAEQFNGYYDNTDIPKRILNVMHK
ncbi:MAG: alkaline phosphatase, partial [FCB group bacterium]|nr:alkaline phosphatase [FCB group bacterium]